MKQFFNMQNVLSADSSNAERRTTSSISSRGLVHIRWLPEE